MPIYTLTPCWGVAYAGATETYITPELSASRAKTVIERFMVLRLGLMPADAYIVGLRVSIYGENRRSVLLLPGTDLLPNPDVYISFNSKGTYVPPAVTGLPVIMRDTLMVNYFFDSDRTGKKYLSGVPRTLIGIEPASLDWGDPADWCILLKGFFAYLINQGFQVRAQDKGVGNPIYRPVGIVQGPPGKTLLGIQIAASEAPSVVRGDKVLTQNFRSAKGTRLPTINGSWTVDSVDVAGLPSFVTLYLRNSEGIDPLSVRFSEKSLVRKSKFRLYPITSYIPKAIVPHKRGKAGSSLRGRRLTRRSLES